MKWFNWRDTRWGAYTFATCSAVILFVLLQHLGTIGSGVAKFIGFFSPVIYGVIIAYIMDFFVKFIEQKIFFKMESTRNRRYASVATATVIVVVFFLMLFATVIPQIVSSITDLIVNWDRHVTELTKMVTNIGSTVSGAGLNLDVDTINSTIDTLGKKVSEYLSENSGEIITRLSSIGSALATWLISFIIAVYFLMAKEDLLRGLQKLLRISMSEKTYLRSGSAFYRINGIFSKYIVCEILDALIVGAANAIFMLIAGIPYVALISVVVGVTNLAPTFGPIVGGVVGAFVLLLVHPAGVIPFLIFTIIIQTIDGYVIKPKMYGGALSVPSVWILVAIIVLGRMFGVVGILLAIPVAAIITYWIRDYFNNYVEDDENNKIDNNEKPDPAKAENHA